jgi:membrane protease YdiL (CAAX protease family)
VGASVAFFVLTFAGSWIAWLSAGALTTAAAAAPAIEVLRTALLYLGTFMPAIVGLALTRRIGGPHGLRRLTDRLFLAEVGARWYLFAVSYMAVTKLTVAAIYRVAFGTWPVFGSEPVYLILIALVFSTVVQAGEEIGWRGFALPRMAARVGFGRASLVLGVIWAVWHLPLFFVTGMDNYGQSFAAFLAGVVAISVAMTWLYAHTRGSLLLVMLMHSAVNQTRGIVPSAVPGATDPLTAGASTVAWLTAAVLWSGAIYFLVRMPAPDPKAV